MKTKKTLEVRFNKPPQQARHPAHDDDQHSGSNGGSSSGHDSTLYEQIITNYTLR